MKHSWMGTTEGIKEIYFPCCLKWRMNSKRLFREKKKTCLFMLGIRGWMRKRHTGSGLGFVVKLEAQKQITTNESNMLLNSNRGRDGKKLISINTCLCMNAEAVGRDEIFVLWACLFPFVVVLTNQVWVGCSLHAGKQSVWRQKRRGTESQNRLTRRTQHEKMNTTYCGEMRHNKENKRKHNVT